MDMISKWVSFHRYKRHLEKMHNKILVKGEVKDVVELDNCSEAVISNNER